MAESEAPESEAEVMRRGAAMLADRLPKGWSSSLTPQNGSIDALFEIRDEAGTTATLIVEAKRIVEQRDIASLKTQLDAYRRQFSPAQSLVVARYLSPPVRAKLAEAGLSYIDATGNMRVELSRPGLFLSDRGADNDPWRGPGRPLGTLKGEPAAKIVRAVADLAGPWTVRQLVDVSRASTARRIESSSSLSAREWRRVVPMAVSTFRIGCRYSADGVRTTDSFEATR